MKTIENNSNKLIVEEFNLNKFYQKLINFVS